MHDATLKLDQLFGAQLLQDAIGMDAGQAERRAEFLLRQRQLETEKGETRDALVPHPLSWWTKNPLRLDTSGDLMLGFKAPDGELLTTRDYSEQQTVSILGTLSPDTKSCKSS